MGGELVASPQRGEQSPLVSYSEIFRKYEPLYLSWGMTRAEYWNDDCDLARVYRKKHQYEMEQRNHELWLQGFYIYEAMLCVSPVFHDFAKNPKPLPYREEPFPITPKAQEEVKETKEETARELQKDHLVAWMQKVNKKMRERDNDKC